MNKGHVLKELSSYLDNQLSDNERLKIENHLRDCKICSKELSRLKLLSEKLKTWQAPDLDANFDASVRNEIVLRELQGGAVKMKKKTLAILIPSSALAGILVIILLGGLMNRYLKPGAQGRLKETRDQIGKQYESYSINKGRTREGVDFSYGLRAGTSQIAKHEYEAWGGVPTAAGAKEYGSTLSSGEGSVIVIQPVLPATGEGEKIIRTAEVKLEVRDGKETYKKASEICQDLGGYLAASNFYKDAEGRESGTITMRIPKDKFLTALERLNALGKVENSSTNSQDVSQEYANLKSHLDAAMVVYNKMLEALQKRQTTIPEAARLESELTPILQRIEGLKNQLEYLNNAVSFTTITVQFHEPRVSAKVLEETKKHIQESILTAKINAVKFLTRAIPVAIVVVIWGAIVLGIAILVKYWVIRLFKRG